jgi:hypothetical protein
MLSVFESTHSRRAALQAGFFGVAGLGLADVLRLQASASSQWHQKPKSLIMIYLLGGPSHMDMYDLKPDALVEYRGEFKPTKTNVPGMDICELMPRQAKIADKIAIVRGIEFHSGHNIYEHTCGFRPLSTPNIGPNPRPAFGSVVSKVRSKPADAVPQYVALGDSRLLGGYDVFETPAYLGPAHAPFESTGPGMNNLSLHKAISLDRFEDRKGLLNGFDDFRDRAERRATLEVDPFRAKALGMLASSKTREAFDLSRESPKVRDSYGGYTDFLLARRLVEAGVSVVTLPARFYVKIPQGPDPGGWDTHAHNFHYLRAKLPRYDHAISALIEDLDNRGMLDDVVICAWGDFGRKPRIGDVTPDGRGHWGESGFAFLAGGGLKTGQVVGESDARGERPRFKAIRPYNVLATLYKLLGIDAAQTFPDSTGRPQFVLDDRDPLHALL